MILLQKYALLLAESSIYYIHHQFVSRYASHLYRDATFAEVLGLGSLDWELRNIYHHHPESKKRKSSEENSGFIHPYGRCGNAVKTTKTISTIAILWPVKAIFEKRAATVEVDSFVSPVGTQGELKVTELR